MTHGNGFWIACAVAALASACAADDRDAHDGLDDDGAVASERDVPAADAAPTEDELCEIILGKSSRAEVERVLGVPDTTRETVERVQLLYEFAGSTVTIVLHLDKDVFRDFVLYGMRVPSCWAAQAKQMTQGQARAGAGAAS